MTLWCCLDRQFGACQNRQLKRGVLWDGIIINGCRVSMHDATLLSQLPGHRPLCLYLHPLIFHCATGLLTGLSLCVCMCIPLAGRNV